MPEPVSKPQILAEVSTDELIQELYRRALALQIGMVTVGDGNRGAWRYAVKGGPNFQSAIGAGLTVRASEFLHAQSHDAQLRGRLWPSES
ncbi:MAG: hypothetical protein HS116_18390 [Planctomycetes bacterium]|nr:hypothetical protein [Planctomycetota bacterium]